MSDKAFREWIQKQPSCVSGAFAEHVEEIGEWRNPACHVRRAADAGTAYKPEFSAVPMTHEEHHIQSTKGELDCLLLCSTRVKLVADLTILARRNRDKAVRKAKEWFDERAEWYLKRWLRDTPEGRRYAAELASELTATQ